MPLAITLRHLRNLAAVMALGLLLSGCGVNNIPTYDEQAKAKWADVNNQYQRRADLIPNLVETVRGYARQERETLEAVVNARAKATSIQVTPDIVNDPAKFKQFQEAQSQLSGALGRLIAVSENYPDLKSNQNFLALQAQLEGTENRISVARRDYIDPCVSSTPSCAPSRACYGPRRFIAAISRWRRSRLRRTRAGRLTSSSRR